MTAEDKQKLVNLAQQLYSDAGREFTPKYPWVVVYVIPKEQKTASGIWIPDLAGDKKQNKVLYEGIVLQTWEPFMKYIRVKTHPVGSNGDQATESWTDIEMKSELHPGDHVLFPHYEGLPLPWTNEEEFRIIRESNPKDPEGRCEVFGKLEYELESDEEVILDIIGDSEFLTGKELINKLKEKFYLVRRRTTPLTLSGSR